MSTDVPGFQSFFRGFSHHFVLAILAKTSIRLTLLYWVISLTWFCRMYTLLGDNLRISPVMPGDLLDRCTLTSHIFFEKTTLE